VIRRLRGPLALLCGIGSIALFVAQAPADRATPPEDPLSGENGDGRALYEEGCSTCHGFDLRGVDGRGPSLRGVGEQAADFYLRTGRMPLNAPGDQPLRNEPRYSAGELDALIRYVGSLGGPAVPAVDPAAGSVSRGQELFTANCSGCHAISGRGGVVVGAEAPELTDSTPTQVAEAIRIGPYVMPAFSREQLSDDDVDSIARYVEDVVKSPEDRGGWGIGHIGPVPEGMVAWLLAAVALLLVARLIGERSEEPR
jgi:ubiquinol-cytochrome c reductase cytochrome c subunit